jgi:hypothetical protein
MMTDKTFDAVLAQYEQNTKPFGDQPIMSQEDRMKRYFAAILPKGENSGQRRIRILPTTDGSSPFKEVWFHEIQVNGTYNKFYDPDKNEGGRSPLTEVYEELMKTGKQSDKDLAAQYKARKFYIVKLLTVTTKRTVLNFGDLSTTTNKMVSWTKLFQFGELKVI